MRRLKPFLPAGTAALTAIAGCIACAGMQPPPGGPLDKTPPTLVSVRPDSGALNQRPDFVEFTFDETVSDHPARGELDQYFLISPREGDPRISWRRSRVDVRPRNGFRPNTAYTVTMLPGLSDIRGNTMTSGAAVTFSTGSTFPQFGVEGRIFDWQAERPAAGAVVEAIARADSTVYIAVADSTGAYKLGPFGPGAYRVEGFIDQNTNRVRDRTEAWDSHDIVISGSRPVLELLAIQRDTIPPRIASLARVDSTSLSVTFDRPIEPSQTLTPALFRVQRADSTPLAIAQVLTTRQAQARADSLRRATSDSGRLADTTRRADTARRADTTRRVDSAAARRGLPPSAVPLPGAARRPGTPPAAAEPGTVGAAPFKPSQPAPPTSVVLLLAPPALLEPGATYRVTVRDVRGLTGRATTTERTLSVPRPAPTPPAKTPAPAAATPPKKPGA